MATGISEEVLFGFEGLDLDAPPACLLLRVRSVTSNPVPMEELTPYTHIEPPHLHGFLESNGGQFLLTPLANGGTRLEGTTWYHHRLWPAAYWRVWSDAIIHRIHMRVLQHIQLEAEGKAGATRRH